MRNDSIKKLAGQGTIQPSLYDKRNLPEVASPDYTGDYRNPLPADERARKRKLLRTAAEKKLDAVVKAVSRKSNHLRVKDKIGRRIGRELKILKCKSTSGESNNRSLRLVS